MSIEISRSVLNNYYKNILSDFTKANRLININHTLYFLTSYCGKQGLCIPIDLVKHLSYDRESILDKTLVEVFYIYEMLTVEEMLTHESKEVQFLGVLTSKKEVGCEI